MTGKIVKWVIPGLVTVVGGTVLALATTSAPIATDLETRSIAALKTGNSDWAAVTIDGRDVVLRGTATTQPMIDAAISQVAGVAGVRDVQSNIVLAEIVSPFPFSALVEGGKMTLRGGYPSENVHAVLLAEAGDATDTTRMMSGAPDASSFEAAAKFGISALKQFDTGEITLADLSLAIEGRARSIEAYTALQTLRASTPAGVQLVSLVVTPPLASPYVWTASFDGTKLDLRGNVPDEGLEERLRALAPSALAVSTELELASGAPSEFTPNILKLLQSLLSLESGTIAVSDGTITLTGAPATAAVSEKVIAEISEIGGVAMLEPPYEADFTLGIAKSGKALRFDGFVPDPATRDRLAQIADADASSLQLARGAPEDFTSGLDYGIDMLNHFSEGRFELRGQRLSLNGRAATVSDFTSVLAKAEKGAPQGFELAMGDIRPPVADPFVFSAVKSRAGDITVSGFVPDAKVRGQLLGKITSLAGDTSNPADGGPDNFGFLAGKGLEVLALLDSGTLNYDGGSWSIVGSVDDPQEGFAADALYSEAGLRTMGWTYEVALDASALPIIAPYAWRAQKSAAGEVSFTGFVPSESVKSRLNELGGGGRDGTALGAGAPDDFGNSAAAGLDALLALDEGSLGLNGTRWTLTGAVADAASRARIQDLLASKVNAASWQIAIQARDSAPVVTPYLWSATKADTGTIDLGGYLPNEALRTSMGGLNVGRDTMAIASGEPAGFSEDVRAGLEALSHLREGKAAFDGSKWLLTGTADTQDQGAAAIAALLKGSHDGALWTNAIAGYTAAPALEAASSEPPSSAEQPAESNEPVASIEASVEPVISMEPSVEPSMEGGTDEPSVADASEPEASEASAEMPSVEADSIASVPAEAEPVESASSAEISAEVPVQAEPSTEDRSLLVVDPLPAQFVFDAIKDRGLPIVLKGGVPTAETAAEFGTIAGDAPIDGLVPQEGLPDDFASNGLAGLTALAGTKEGRLGFDGARWWLRGMVESAGARDTLAAGIAALPDGAEWSVFIGVLPPLEICRDHVAGLERRNAITFESGSAKLTEASLPVIDELAIDLNICPTASVHVEGHTDSDGADDLNLALSVSRAETVVDALIERGVAIERLYAEGFGESRPIADNDTRDGKASNRRIAFSISEE